MIDVDSAACQMAKRDIKTIPDGEVMNDMAQAYPADGHVLM